MGEKKYHEIKNLFFPYPSIISISRSKRAFQNFSSGRGQDDNPNFRLILIDPPSTGNIGRRRIAIAAAILLSDLLQAHSMQNHLNSLKRRNRFSKNKTTSLLMKTIQSNRPMIGKLTIVLL
jgi:hypothetical protein